MGLYECNFGWLRSPCHQAKVLAGMDGDWHNAVQKW